MSAPAAHPLRQAEIRYAQVWEDPRVMAGALRVRPGETVFSIASAGDNALALLLDDPARVVALDFNPAQTALVELKVAALKTLDYEAYAAFLGLTNSAARPAFYHALRPLLSPEARAFWDARPGLIRRGVLHAGRFERYFRLFRRAVLPLVHPPRLVRALLACPHPGTQRLLYRRCWNNRRWRLLFRLFFGKTLLGRLGRDPAAFAHVEEERVADRFLRRVERAISGTPVRDNYFLEYILTGRYSGRNGLPPYLNPAHFETLRARADRLEIVREDALSFLRRTARRFDAFNLSDLFEWMSPAETETLLGAVARAARPGARLCYWNLLVPRRRPESLAHLIRPDEPLARALHAGDRTFFYGGFVVEEVP